VLLLTETLLLLGTFERRFALFGRIFWRGSKHHKAISITFDDGPNDPYTSQILDILKEFNVKATFFVIGQNASMFPETLKREIEEGHEIGNHTHNHEVIPLKSPNYIRNQIIKTSDLIANATGIHPRLFRTPHGWRNPYVKSIATQEKLTTVAWTLGVWDTDRPGTDLIIKRTLKGIKEGCILLLHDGRGTEHEADSSQLVKALPVIINEAKKQGYKFLTLSEMMRDK
jgi:peptidoglycan-N-acetylglucosamine deacetylase